MFLVFICTGFLLCQTGFFFLIGIAMHLIVSDIMTGHLTGGRGKLGQTMDEQDVIVINKCLQSRETIQRIRGKCCLIRVGQV